MSQEEQEQLGVYLQMNGGFIQPRNVIKLNLSVYGINQILSIF